MRVTRIATAISLLITVAADHPPRFAVGDLKFALSADDVVGARRSGLLCTPAGKLHWRDITPGEAALRRSIARGFAAAGIDIKIPSDDDFDNEVRTPYRITVSILAVAANACVPWRGIRVGDQSRLKLRGRIVTVWRVFDQHAHSMIEKLRICRDLRADAGSPDKGEPLRTAVSDMTREVVPLLSTNDAQSHPGRQSGCDSREQRLPDDI